MFSWQKYYSFASVAVVSSVLVSCAGFDPEAVSDSPKMIVGVGAPVPAALETEAVVTRNADAADDPEIWVDPRDPNRAVIFGTDKQAGLYSYGLDGKITGFIPDGRLNNVDLRGSFPTPQGERVLVAASDRGRMGAALYLMDPATLETKPWGVVPMDLVEPYGLCVGRQGDRFIVIVNSTDGQVRQVEVKAGPDGAIAATEQRRFAVPSQSEGCVVDDVRGLLYLGEEAKGIWRFPLDPAAGSAGALIAAAPSEMLQPDVEGLTLVREASATYLVASSQGDSAYAVWRVDAEPAYLGRFSIMGANSADPVTGTDGIAGYGGAVGPFPGGLFVAQDDSDTEGEQPTAGRARQNFKLVDWREVKRALQIP
jgi:3-phytase